MLRKRLADVFLFTLKILIPIMILFPIVYFTFHLIDIRITDVANVGNESYHSGFSFYVFASHTILFFVNLCALFVCLVGWIVSKCYRSSPIQKRHLSYFRYSMLSLPLSHVLYFLIHVLVLNLI